MKPARSIFRSILAPSVALLLFPTLAPAQLGSYSITWDDFKDGFSATGPDAKWFYFAFGPYVGDDGIETTSNKGLKVVSSGTNSTTGLPAYVRTLGQETDPVDNPFGLPGGLDHVKWLAMANHLATTGFPGFDAVHGRELRFDAWISGRSYGNEFHPFGSAVADPDDDVRLAASAMPTIDFENFIVADFFFTNKRIYAIYERLPFGRTVFNNYAAFTYAIPVGTRQPHQQHHVTVAYDRTANVFRWLIDDQEVFRVENPGRLLPSREHMIIDHGGIEEDVECRQRNVSLGMFTLLDGAYPGQAGLVQLSAAPGFYFDTATGMPVAQTFLDILSLHNSRVWGAGGEINVRKVRVSSR